MHTVSVMQKDFVPNVRLLYRGRAALAGRSARSEPWRDRTSRRPGNWSTSASKTWSTALRTATGVKADGPLMHSSMLKKMVVSTPGTAISTQEM